MRAFVPAAVLVLLAAADAARPQPPAQAARVELVQIDVVVTDAQGRLVHDLGQDDFQVLEDGKPQRVSLFAGAGVRPGASPGDLSDAGSAHPDEAPEKPGRSIAILVDDLHIDRGDAAYTRQALLALLADHVREGDNVGLFTTSPPGVVENLTQDRSRLRVAIENLGFRELAIEKPSGSQLTPAQAELVLRGDPSALKLGARTMLDDANSGFSDSVRNRVPGLGFTPAGIDPEEKAAAEEVQRQARAVLAEVLRFSVATLSRTDSILRGLAALPGRKLCILVSGGFLVGAGTSDERTRELMGVVDAATRSGTVLYALDVHGLSSRTSDAAIAGKAALPGLDTTVNRQSEMLYRTTLDTIARDTGGFVVRATNDLATGLGRMMQDNEAYYLMAYAPTNLKRDGKFRRIDVRIAGHRDYGVRTRRGYFAPDDRRPDSTGAPVPTLAAAGPAPSLPRGVEEAEARALLSDPLPPSGLPTRVAADYVDLPPAGPQAVVLGTVDLSALRWEQAEGRHRASMEMVGGVYDAEGKLFGAPFARRVELDLGEREYERAREDGLQFQQQVALPPGRYQVRFVARETRFTQSGGSADWLEIPDLADRKLAMSSVFLSTAGGSLRSVQARRRFKRTENLLFQFYVYNAPEASDRDVVFQAQIWTGQKLVAASKPRPVALERKDTVPLPESNGMGLETLTAGAYELRVLVVDRKTGAAARRALDFTVE